jgi:hypothetical protein
MRLSGSMLLLAALCFVTGCGANSSAIPPCNAWIFLFGAADLTLDCPATNAIKLFERAKAPPP